MEKSSYFELLKDPRWQKKRLEILNRDNWECQICESKEKTLHVHHLYYLHNNPPWEYPDHALLTLCENCHEIETEALSAVTHDLILMLKQRGFTSSNFTELFNALNHCDLSNVEMLYTINEFLNGEAGKE